MIFLKCWRFWNLALSKQNVIFPNYVFWNPEDLDICKFGNFKCWVFQELLIVWNLQISISLISVMSEFLKCWTLSNLVIFKNMSVLNLFIFNIENLVFWRFGILWFLIFQRCGILILLKFRYFRKFKFWNLCDLWNNNNPENVLCR